MTGVPPGAGRPRVGFLFIGGEHHILHIAPVLVELARRGEVEVVAYVADDKNLSALRRSLDPRPPPIEIRHLALPFWAAPIERSTWRWSALKLPRLIMTRGSFAGLDLLVVAERTSTVLKLLPGPAPYLVHIPHGAGDRAKGFEARLGRFDHVIVAGRKDRDRMVGEGLVRADDCSVSGYIKLAAVRAQRRTEGPVRLFANDRPVVLYNPHFAPGLSSWRRFGPRLIAAFRVQDKFNLVVAPHVRLREKIGATEVRATTALAVDDRIIVDFGSSRSHDMSYTLGADIYVGDVSSQIYEFVADRRPCVLLNPGVAGWANDPNYRFWHFGEVIDDPGEVLAAIERASARHAVYRPAQDAGVAEALGPDDGRAIGIAAGIVTRLARARAARHR